MLLFSTLLDISESMTKEDFFNLVFEWNRTNPRAENIIPDAMWNGVDDGHYGRENLSLDTIGYPGLGIVAVRYRKVALGGVVWDTDYIFDSVKKKLSIQLSRSYEESALRVDPSFSTPHFISLLEDGGYLAPDLNLQATRHPLNINKGNMDLLADIVNGKMVYRLPVVYVSKKTGGDDPIPDVRRFASRLKGVAHVLVEESVKINSSLKSLTGGKCETNGAVGVYYPVSALGHKSYRSSDNLAERIIGSIIGYSNSQSLNPLYAWGGVNAALLLDQVEKISSELKQKETANNEWISYADSEIESYQGRIAALVNENEALRAEVAGLRRKQDASGAEPLIFSGREKDFFDGEIRDMVISVLKESKGRLKEGTRRFDVISDILDSNESEELAEARINEIKRLLKGYDGLSAPLRQRLQEMGFVITEDGKHIKLTYYGDERYQTIFAKTPSDYRSGANNALEICKKMF